MSTGEESLFRPSGTSAPRVSALRRAGTRLGNVLRFIAVLQVLAALVMFALMFSEAGSGVLLLSGVVSLAAAAFTDLTGGYFFALAEAVEEIRTWRPG